MQRVGQPGSRMIRDIVTSLAIVAGGGFAPSLMAAALSGFYIIPFVEVMKIYDDNIFFSTSSPEKDEILRIRSTIVTGYHSNLATIEGRYTFDYDRYKRHTELNNEPAREYAALDYQYQASRMSRFTTHSDYTKTQTPGELSPQVGSQLGRTQAERITFTPGFNYRFNTFNSSDLSYNFARDKLGDEINDTHTLAFGFDSELSRRNTISFRYRYEKYEFEATDPLTSYSILGGGSHKFTPLSNATVIAGLRFGDNKLNPDPEVAASYLHKFQNGEVGIDYSLRETTVLGLTGTATAESIGVSLAYSFGPSVHMYIIPQYYVTHQDEFETRVVVTNLGIEYRLSKYYALNASYDYSAQQGSLTAATDDEIIHNVITLSLVIGLSNHEDFLAKRIATDQTDLLDKDQSE